MSQKTVQQLDAYIKATAVVYDHSNTKLINRKTKVKPSKKQAFLSVLNYRKSTYDDCCAERQPSKRWIRRQPSCKHKSRSHAGKQKLQIFIRTPLLHTPKTLCFQLDPRTSILTLKELIGKTIGVEARCQRLYIRRNFELCDLLTLEDNGIEKDENISLCFSFGGLLGGGPKERPQFDQFLLDIVPKIETTWKELANKLGFEEAEIVEIQAKNENDSNGQSLAMLFAWWQKQRKSKKAPQRLREALIASGVADLASKVPDPIDTEHDQGMRGNDNITTSSASTEEQRVYQQEEQEVAKTSSQVANTSPCRTRTEKEIDQPEVFQTETQPVEKLTDTSSVYQSAAFMEQLVLGEGQIGEHHGPMTGKQQLVDFTESKSSEGLVLSADSQSDSEEKRMTMIRATSQQEQVNVDDSHPHNPTTLPEKRQQESVEDLRKTRSLTKQVLEEMEPHSRQAISPPKQERVRQEETDDLVGHQWQKQQLTGDRDLALCAQMKHDQVASLGTGISATQPQPSTSSVSTVQKYGSDRSQHVSVDLKVGGSYNPIFLGPVNNTTVKFIKNVTVTEKRPDVTTKGTKSNAMTNLLWKVLADIRQTHGEEHMLENVIAFLKSCDGELEQVRSSVIDKNTKHNVKKLELFFLCPGQLGNIKQRKRQTGSKRRTGKPEFSESFFLRLSRKMSGDWEKLAFILGFSKEKVESFRANYKDNRVRQCRAMLGAWRKGQNNDEEARQILSSALTETGWKYLARTVLEQPLLDVKTTVTRKKKMDEGLTKVIEAQMFSLIQSYGLQYVKDKYFEILGKFTANLQDVECGSVTFVFRIESREDLDELWSMYTTGYLAKKLTEILITDELTTEDKSDLAIQATILESDYEQACRLFKELEKDQQKDEDDSGSTTEVQHTQPAGSSPTTTVGSSDPAEHAADRCKEKLKTLYMTTGRYSQLVKWVDGDTKKVLMPKLTLVKAGNTKYERVISYEDIFYVKTREGDPINLVLLSGPGDEQKSILLENIAYDWATGSNPTLSNFKLVTVLQMEAIEQESDLIDSIHAQLSQDTDIDRGDLESFIDTNSQKVLVLWDGFDKSISNLEENKVNWVFNFLNRMAARGIRVLVTTCHSDKILSSKMIQEPVTHVTASEVTEVEIEVHLKKINSEEPGLAEDLIDRIKSSEVLSDWATSLQLIPLFCSLSKQSPLSDTLSRLYNQVMKYMFTQQTDMSQELISDVLIALGKSALKGLVSPQKRLTFREEEFEKGALEKALDAGLLICRRVPIGQKSVSDCIQFSHKSTQAYCAAKYCQSLPDKEFQKVLDQIDNPWYFNYLLRFCCGDNEQCCKHILRMLHKKDKELALHCYFESQATHVISEDVIKSFLSRSLRFSGYSNQDTLKSLMWLLQHVAEQTELSGYLDEIRHFTFTSRYLSRLNGVVASRLATMKNLSSVGLHQCKLTDNQLDHILSSLQKATNLTTLRLTDIDLGGTANVWAAQLRCLKNMESLLFGKCNLQMEDMVIITSSGSKMTNLRNLDISDNKDLGGYVGKWAAGVQTMVHLQSLKLGSCNINAQDVPHIASSVGAVLNLTNLDLSGNVGLGGKAGTWAASLQSMIHIRKLDMSDCDIHSSDVKYIARSVSRMENLVDCHFTSHSVWFGVRTWRKGIVLKIERVSLTSENMVNILQLFSNRRDLVTLRLDDIGGLCGSADSWAPPLQNLTHLEEIEIIKCALQSTDIEPIAAAVSQMSNMKSLNLEGNRFLSRFAKSWAPSLKQMKHVTSLKLGGCALTEEDKKHISEAWKGDVDFGPDRYHGRKMDQSESESFEYESPESTTGAIHKSSGSSLQAKQN